MKLLLGIVIGIILGIIVLGAGAFFGIRSLAHALSSESISGSSSSVAGQANTTPSILSTSTSTRSQSTPPPSTSISPTNSQAPSSTSTRVPNIVSFALNLTSYNIFGPTSATLDLQITNTGNVDAHQVWGKVELYYQGTLVKINGQDYYRADIGNLRAGAGVTTRVDLKVNIIDGSKILANGGTFKLTVFSDEYTQDFRFDFKL